MSSVSCVSSSLRPAEPQPTVGQRLISEGVGWAGSFLSHVLLESLSTRSDKVGCPSPRLQKPQRNTNHFPLRGHGLATAH